MMIAEIERLLGPVGLNRARAANPWATRARVARIATAHDVKSLKTKAEDLEAINRVADALIELHQSLTALPSDLRASIDWAGEPNISEALRVVDQISDPVVHALETHAFKPSRGRPKNEEARVVARSTAEIFGIAYGKRPAIGRDANNSRLPTGVYGRAVAELCHYLGKPVGDPVALCRSVLSEMTDDDFHGLGRPSLRPSIFDVVEGEKIRSKA